MLQQRWRSRQDAVRAGDELERMHFAARVIQKHVRGRQIRKGFGTSVRGRAQKRKVHAERLRRDAAARLIERYQRGRAVRREMHVALASLVAEREARAAEQRVCVPPRLLRSASECF